jgi:hypothetical protein
MYRNEGKESLSEVIEDSAPVGKEVAEAAIRNLTIALGIPPEFPGINETSWGRRLLLPGGKAPESNHPLSKQPDSEATLTNMSGAMRHSINDFVKRNDRVLNVKLENVPRIPGPSKPEQQEKHNPLLGEERYPLSSTLYNTQPQTGSQSLPQIGSHPPLPSRTIKKKIFGLPALACAGISAVIAALVAAISVLGAFLGVEVQQNKSLQASVSELIDAVPSCQTTVFTSTILVTETASSTPTQTATTNTSSNSGLSTGAWAGIGVAIGVFVLSLLVVGWFILRRTKLRRITHVSQSPKPTNWDSTTVGYSYQPPARLVGFPQGASPPPVEMGPSHHISPYHEYPSVYPYPGSELSMARSHEHTPASARVADVLQLPDLNVGLYSKDR